MSDAVSDGTDEFNVEADARDAYAKRMGHDRPIEERLAESRRLSTGVLTRSRRKQ